MRASQPLLKFGLISAPGAMIAFLLLSVGCSSVHQRDSFNRNKWLADLDKLEEFMSEAYPNLDVAEANHVELPNLDRETREQLGQSHSNEESLAILNSFVGKFKDGHFRLE